MSGVEEGLRINLYKLFESASDTTDDQDRPMSFRIMVREEPVTLFSIVWERSQTVGM